jgi:putative membrane protein insertion efficiency factor
MSTSPAQRAVARVIALPRQGLIALVLGYRLLFKPWLGSSCRFEPTCSAYALEALRRHGAVAGAALATGRLLRCHPWCAGGCDPVPERTTGLFTRFLPKTRP